MLPKFERTANDSFLRRLDALGRDRLRSAALPRGGVPVAAEVCAALKAPLDLVLVRKVGVPFQPELARGGGNDIWVPAIVSRSPAIPQS